VIETRSKVCISRTKLPACANKKSRTFVREQQKSVETDFFCVKRQSHEAKKALKKIEKGAEKFDFSKEMAGVDGEDAKMSITIAKKCVVVRGY